MYPNGMKFNRLQETDSFYEAMHQAFMDLCKTVKTDAQGVAAAVTKFEFANSAFEQACNQQMAGRA